MSIVLLILTSLPNYIPIKFNREQTKKTIRITVIFRPNGQQTIKFKYKWSKKKESRFCHFFVTKHLCDFFLFILCEKNHMIIPGSNSKFSIQGKRLYN